MGAFRAIGVTTAIPDADNTDPVLVGGGQFFNPADGDSGNVIELQGKVTGGSVYLLRRLNLSPTQYRWVPFAPDKPISGSLTEGFFWDRLTLGEHGDGESFCLYAPNGIPTVTTPLTRLARF